MKKLMYSDGVKTLSKRDQSKIKGGGNVPLSYCRDDGYGIPPCPDGQYCEGIYCYLIDNNGGGGNTGPIPNPHLPY